MAKEADEKHRYKDIDILVFDFMDIRIGIDLAQISEICAKEEADEKNPHVFWIHEKIPHMINSFTYNSPKVLMVQHDGLSTGIVVDMPQKIVSLPITSILPLPAIIERHRKDTCLWGVSIHENNIVLLMDALALANNKTGGTEVEIF